MPAVEHTGRPAKQVGRALLPSVRKPADLDRFTSEELVALAAEIRRYLVTSVARTGGHLGPNLGVVELTIALHRTFRSPRDTIVFDTGHQAYVHKLLTGRQDFSQLRERDGLSGYPSRAESVHDVVENSHASTSLSWADGIARANHLQGHDERHVVAVIGDGAMTGGMAWEALNNIADSADKHLVIVVNDNGRSYAPTIGGLAHHLDALRTNPGYERVLSGVKRTLLSQGAPGRAAFDALHGLKRGLKDVLVPSAFFEDLGVKYTGPVDGHDITALEFALTRAREYAEPVIVHVITEKGRGYTPAEEDHADRFHAVGRIHPETGLPVVPSRFGWTAVVAEELVELARDDERIIGITAAMQQPVGLQPLADTLPERVIDVGIAEQHALAFAAGLAFAGMRPVIALYATFLNRAFDQVLMDVGLHRAGVTILLDRAGITGTDGASHNGMWDMALLAHVPGLHLAAPRDEATLRQALKVAIGADDVPTVVRYPKGSLPAAVPALRTMGEEDGMFCAVDVLLDTLGAAAEITDAREEAGALLLVGVGVMASATLEAGRCLAMAGLAVRVVSPRWPGPVPAALVEMVRHCRGALVVEDGLVDGGVGSQLRDAVEDAALADGTGIVPRVMRLGVPRRFLPTADREELLAEFGMDSDGICAVARRLAGRTKV